MFIIDSYFLSLNIAAVKIEGEVKSQNEFLKVL